MKSMWFARRHITPNWKVDALTGNGRIRVKTWTALTSLVVPSGFKTSTRLVSGSLFLQFSNLEFPGASFPKSFDVPTLFLSSSHRF